MVKSAQQRDQLPNLFMQYRRAVSRSKPPPTHHADDSLPKLWWIACGESTLQRYKHLKVAKNSVVKQKRS